MTQDQGPIQEPPKVFPEGVIVAHSLDELEEKAKGLPYYYDINSHGIVLDTMIRKWRGRQESWEVLKGRRVLDIGSGSAIGKEFVWHPYFARLCAVNGAKVTALDISPQSDLDAELFHGITVDLIPIVVEGRLAEILDEREYDFIHSSEFVGVNPAGELQVLEMNSSFSVRDFEGRLFAQCSALLSEGGVMCLDQADQNGQGVYYTKKAGEIVRI